MSAALPPPRVEQGEQEPLLGSPGANTMPVDEDRLRYNLFSGTAPLAQVGALVLALAVFMGVFTHPISLFTAHPVLNVVGIAVLLQGALVVQPTRTPDQKHNGAIVHSILNGTAILLMYGAFVVILVNKFNHNGTHFESPHAILGLTTYIALFLNATLGVLQFYFPVLIGGVDNGKALYKYHRIIGYSGVLLILSTLIAATYTPYVKNVLHIRTWMVVLASVLILAGTLPRVKLQKLGLKSAPKPPAPYESIN